ncbi:MAG: hypothetical protein IJQ34_07855 [Kiritimatiellae bacterium]|nr:hypothetical protein [Kiritimatiellia bacterium]
MEYDIISGMAWCVKYRSKNGELAETIIEAENRSSLFEVLSKRGITPISVSEHKGKMASAKRRVSKGVNIGVIALVVLVVVLAVAAWRLWRNDDGGGGATALPSGGGATVLPSGGGGATALPSGGGVTALPSGGGVTVLPSGGGEATVLLSDDGEGATDLPSDNVEEEPKKKKRVFEHGSDQLIAMATSAPEGGLIPPLPMISSAETDEFIESLSKPIEIEEDDSEAVKKAKERVQTVRGEIAKILAENPGKEIGDILNEHREIFNENSAIRGEVEAELERIIEEGDIEGAKKYRDTMNYALQQMGISVIDTPITDEERSAAGEDIEDEEEY